MNKALNIQCFLHVPFEGPGLIARWAQDHNHEMNYTRFYENDPLPDRAGIDLLIIMGGSMNVFDYHIHPWMEEEIEWLEAYINEGKAVLGICLGAQIIATALGAEVYPGKHKEIGWFNIRFLPAMGDYRICKNLPATRRIFHWHGDTFNIPEGAIRIAESQAFPNQGFIYSEKVIALQFHLELTPENVALLVENCRDELVPGPYVQTEEELQDASRFIQDNQDLLFRFLDYLS
jgi:GMP synthase-like glutamine amidotransferase